MKKTEMLACVLGYISVFPNHRSPSDITLRNLDRCTSSTMRNEQRLFAWEGCLAGKPFVGKISLVWEDYVPGKAAWLGSHLLGRFHWSGKTTCLGRLLGWEAICWEDFIGLGRLLKTVVKIFLVV